MATVEQNLEALLFYRGEPESRERLASLLSVTLEELDEAVHLLAASLGQRGIRLLIVDDQLELVTAPETNEAITRARKEEVVRELGKAGAETLAIVLYRGPITRTDIEFIRGVNCSFILRNLMIRGLIERIPNKEQARSVVYRATPETLQHLGITSIDALPEYAHIREQVAAFEARAAAGDLSDPSAHQTS